MSANVHRDPSAECSGIREARLEIPAMAFKRSFGSFHDRFSAANLDRQPAFVRIHLFDFIVYYY